MRISILLDSFPTFSETFIYNQIYFLIDKGYNVTVYSIKGGKTIIHEKVSIYNLEEKVIYLRHGFQFMAIKNFLKFPIVSIKNLKILSLKKYLFYLNNLDIFYCLNGTITHSHFGHTGELIGFLKNIGLLRKTEIVHSFHGFDLLPNRSEYYRIKYKNLFKYGKIFTVNSKYTLELLENISDVKPKSICLLPELLDTKYFSKSMIKSPKSFRLIFIGRLISWKAPILAIMIIQILNDKGLPVFLDIIGDGNERKDCEDYIVSNKLQEVVTLWGVLDQKDIKLKLEEASVFIAPGITDPITCRAENQGLVIQEAQSMELPVIVSDAGGMKYGLIDGVTGYVIEEGNIEAFAERIIFLINNPDFRIEMGKKGRQFVKENFDSNVLGLELLEIYKS
jgi:colanic acid/amylovoran biosynthesis glycosyltransferase